MPALCKGKWGGPDQLCMWLSHRRYRALAVPPAEVLFFVHVNVHAAGAAVVRVPLSTFRGGRCQAGVGGWL